ncbi:MAG: ABC transporter ATP-binding protein [Clostridium sp.]|jgi:ABC-2 type transport system ATP-binding protein|nr:ABC transporter ATP-binding protein [Clostridium sp.]
MKIEATRLSKKIQGHEILKNIDLELEGGYIYGLYGRNGSGKTMLLRCLAGIVDLSSGEILCDGRKLHRDMDVLPDLGMMVENMGFWKMYSGFENLKALAGIRRKVGDERIRQILDTVGLNPQDRRSVRKYSLGMRQRLAIAQALMEDPRILLLDEPTNALDESGVELFRQLMREEKEKGVLILIASHNQEDLELLSDRKLRMVDGCLYAEEGKHDKEH